LYDKFPVVTIVIIVNR